MQQSRLTSLIESATGIVVGFGLAIAAQILIFPVYGLHLPMRDNVRIALLFTTMSLLRGYVLRRAFVWIGGRR